MVCDAVRNNNQKCEERTPAKRRACDERRNDK